MAEFNINKWQDLQLNNRDLYNQFLTYWQSGNYEDALNIIQNNASLNTQSFVAGILNTISTALLYLEENYFNNVESALAEDLDSFNLAIYNFINKNTYSSTAQYYINNFVLYNSQIYMCIQDSYGNEPTNQTYWALIGLQGANGVYGTGLNLQYSWNSTINYVQYDVVYIDDALYVALQANTNQNPTTATNYWQILLNVPNASITISTEAPTSPFNGQIWWQYNA